MLRLARSKNYPIPIDPSTSQLKFAHLALAESNIKLLLVYRFTMQFPTVSIVDDWSIGYVTPRYMATTTEIWVYTVTIHIVEDVDALRRWSEADNPLHCNLLQRSILCV